jgi:hypothetical protein
MIHRIVISQSLILSSAGKVQPPEPLSALLSPDRLIIDRSLHMCVSAANLSS